MSHESTHEHLSHRQVGHDARSHLQVVTMGLDLLMDIRTDEDLFRQVLESIRRDGVEPLKQSITTLVELGSDENSGLPGSGGQVVSVPARPDN